MQQLDLYADAFASQLIRTCSTNELMAHFSMSGAGERT